MTAAIAPGATAAPAAKDPVQTAAKQLEAFFLRRLLAEARPQGGGGIDGGFAGDTFKQMLDEAVADKMAAAGGVGLAGMFAKQLGGKGAVQAQPQVGPLGEGPAKDPSRSIELGPQLDGLPQLAMPVRGVLTSGYGYRPDPVLKVNTHPGVDLAAAMGTPVAAASGGTVTHAGPAGTYGNLVMIKHDNGFETRYAHLSAVDVKAGQRVAAGELVGKVGSTGYSTGPHLHFEVRKDGKTLDPGPLLPGTHGKGHSHR
ncbi:MAG: M23 family metallopeptidase [Deltaproteobacteria bacterium]|nr:M23 family metallopeptidase [Deltaproteobacteria bacterium]